MSEDIVDRMLDKWQHSEENCYEAADEIKRLRDLVFDAYCEGFQDGKDGGWIVGPSGEPWKKSYARTALFERNKK